jgi:hypothetical protein
MEKDKLIIGHGPGFGETGAGGVARGASPYD